MAKKRSNQGKKQGADRAPASESKRARRSRTGGATPARPETKGRKKRAPGGGADLGGAEAFVRPGEPAIPLFVVQKEDYDGFLASAPARLASWLKAIAFRPGAGRSALLPGDQGPLAALVVVETATCPWDYADLPRALPAGVYDAEPDLDRDTAEALCLGWALGCYRFERYKRKKSTRPQLVWPEEARRERMLAVVEAIYLVRDLITTPASDMGPADLAEEAKRVARRHGAKVGLTVGDALIEQNYPMIHAVGRASERAPLLIDLRWGKRSAPRLTLVGKGVCFDTGGLDLKPAQYMQLMKKDMGGGALVLGLAHAIMSLQLPLQLRVLIPAVENSVSGNAMRPLDVLQTRQGLTVEVGDTDAEGRLVLADALTEAVSEKPDLLIDAATLTGAARVALGASLPAIFANRAETGQELEAAAERTFDPLWRLPLHDAYRRKLDSRVADISSTGDALGGAITAALFLREFATKDVDWVHMDTMAYNTDPLPGRPRGGEALGLRALLTFIEARFGS